MQHTTRTWAHEPGSRIGVTAPSLPRQVFSGLRRRLSRSLSLHRARARVGRTPGPGGALGVAVFAGRGRNLC
ncbi:uncharacterized protein K452DRAFT_120292 [Aplosporella prunicola CBS 121167]|uniref:Uncharacterized protein n=1 Tax=Aplosporella prunicola CBS 121167 TaxID=1176127 RepID=A0A6A6BMV5_9PEZI|nr:uncharacterized protein K452DRAFT_120292 [Aplosporella prunicola CBS 121167]KAF2145469.1 hypothetical protein K452DRAFT_120292 [Aplosporella prunicola CBS 121167]